VRKLVEEATMVVETMMVVIPVEAERLYVAISAR